MGNIKIDVNNSIETLQSIVKHNIKEQISLVEENTKLIGNESYYSSDSSENLKNKCQNVLTGFNSEVLLVNKSILRIIEILNGYENVDKQILNKLNGDVK